MTWKLILLEELGAGGAPFGPLAGCDQVADAIIGYGGETLRREVLPRIARGDATFWQGFSEPDAGSDLLALKTRARRDGDAYVVDGHKIWSSHAGIADYGLVLARTDPAAPRHRGLSMLVVDNRLPGMDIRPIRTDADHAAALKEIERLWAAKSGSRNGDSALQVGLATPPLTGMIESSGRPSIATRAAKGGLALSR